MRYNTIHDDIVKGTAHFDVPGTYLDLCLVGDSADRHHARPTNSRESNGSTKTFVITIDPQKLYTLGVSTFSLVDVTLGIRSGAFGEGTEFMSPGGRVRIMDGKLKYTRNKALYKLPDIRV